MSLNAQHVTDHCRRTWVEHVVPALQDYIAIPNVSPAFDPDWAGAGHMDRAVELARAWCASRPIAGLTVEVVRLPGRTPVLMADVPAFGDRVGDDGDDTTGAGGSRDSSAVHGTGAPVLLYGHLDKQPPMTDGWHEGLGPWQPVIRDGRLYGRGSADDGYATFASLTAIEAVQAAGGAHARCLVLIECSEESGSPDLAAYVDHLADRFDTPGLVICLDSSCGSYDRLWATTSLRGMMAARLRVDILTEGVHSGSAGGLVPSSFRILRLLLDRIEDAATGRILVPELWVDVPEGRRREAGAVAAEAGEAPGPQFPLVAGATVVTASPADQLLARTWEPSVSYIGAGGLPPASEAGNVLRPWTELVLSFRLPPRCPAGRAAAALKQVLEENAPYGARVSFEVAEPTSGWGSPPTAPWLAEAMDAASGAIWGNPARSRGEGGSIPFMAMLGERFPEAQFLITGVLGPGSNAHGPNEFLHLAMAEGVTAATALILDAHAHRPAPP